MKFLVKLFVKLHIKISDKWKKNPIFCQEKIFKYLIKNGEKTEFGKNHNFKNIYNYEEFKDNVPIIDYEGLKKYINRIKRGEKNILWPGTPLFLAKTSGTTSGTKFIPLTKRGLKMQINQTKSALIHYLHESFNFNLLFGKMIFLQGSPKLDKIGKVNTGRLSGIVANFVPFYLRAKRLPSYTTNCINEWEKKINKIVDETLSEDLRLIGGIPPWLIMYFEKLNLKTNKKIYEIFPNLSLIVHGGVNFQPYKKKFNKTLHKNIDMLELYPASEGFIAFQDKRERNDMLLLVNSGIYYEFISVSDFNNNNLKNRICLKDVKLEVDYVLILNTISGLWGYNIGDTVLFTSIRPYRIKITGRVKHFSSLFGEHLIVKEVEQAIEMTIKNFSEVVINEFTLAPNLQLNKEISFHEWYIEFSKEPNNLEKFSKILDENLQIQNIYYKDLVQGKVISPSKIIKVKKGGFNNYMKSIGKLGGQNKIPRLSNGRDIVDNLV